MSVTLKSRVVGPATSVGTRVAVMMGGRSSEREVSLESGRAVLESLRGAGVSAFPFDPSSSSLGEMLKNKPTSVFLALHGKGGEDGTMQRRLEVLGVRYTGSGPRASSIAMNKELTKKAFCRAGVPTAPYRVLRKEDIDGAGNACKDLGYPLVVKPASEGSSLGVSIARGPFALRDGLLKAMRYGSRALVERRIDGREFCVGILGAETLPAVEVIYAGEFFSYEAKYEDDATSYRFDQGLPEGVVQAMEKVSLAAFHALGCRHFARVDLMLSSHDFTPYVLEVNTLPGLTSHSLLPMAARRCGLSFTELCLKILALSGESGLRFGS